MTAKACFQYLFTERLKFLLSIFVSDVYLVFSKLRGVFFLLECDAPENDSL